MKYAEARKIALAYLNDNAEQRGYRIGIYEPAQECEFGWIFDFDPEDVIQAHSIWERVVQWKAEGKPQHEITQLLTAQEAEFLEKAISPVGTRPFLVDSQTGEITHIVLPTEVALQELRDKRQGRVRQWGLFRKSQVSLQQMAQLRQALELSANQVIQLVKQPQIPLFKGEIRTSWYLQRRLSEIEIQTELKEID